MNYLGGGEYERFLSAKIVKAFAVISRESENLFYRMHQYMPVLVLLDEDLKFKKLVLYSNTTKNKLFRIFLDISDELSMSDDFPAEFRVFYKPHQNSKVIERVYECSIEMFNERGQIKDPSINWDSNILDYEIIYDKDLISLKLFEKERLFID